MRGTSVIVSVQDPLVAEAVGVALAGTDEAGSVEVAEDATTLSSALSTSSSPTLVVADARRLDEIGGPDTVAELSTREPPVTCVVVIDAEDAARALDLLEAGALGCVSTTQGLADLIQAIELALRGEHTVPPPLLGPLLRQLVARRRADTEVVRRFDALSPREREVLGLLAAGRDQDNIAAILVISPQTVRTHIHRIMTKLDVRSRVHAAHLAAEYGLVDRGVRAGGGPDATVA